MSYKGIPKKTIDKAIEKVKAEKNVSKEDKDFLVNWLKDGYNGPDELLKEELLRWK